MSPKRIQTKSDDARTELNARREHAVGIPAQPLKKMATAGGVAKSAPKPKSRPKVVTAAEFLIVSAWPKTAVTKFSMRRAGFIESGSD
jgi:hypothetical protein